MSREARTAAARNPARQARRALLRGLAWVSPWLVGFALFLAYPIALGLYYSLTDYSILEPPVFIGADNYRELLRDALFHQALWNTLAYAALSIPLCMVAAIAVALLLDAPGRSAQAVRAIVFLPTLVPIVAAAIGWLWMFNTEFGLINAALRAIGVEGPDWLGRSPWALLSLVLLSVWTIGGAVVIFGAALREVPASLYEAAALDGVSAWGRLRHITLPQISPAILFNLIVSIIGALQVFVAPLVMTRGGPANSTLFYTMLVYDNAFAYGRMGYASAMAWVQLLLILALTALVLWSSRGLVHYRAI